MEPTCGISGGGEAISLTRNAAHDGDRFATQHPEYQQVTATLCIKSQPRTSITFSAISIPTRSCASMVDAPICGVTDTRG